MSLCGVGVATVWTGPRVFELGVGWGGAGMFKEMAGWLAG